jgi:probable aminopeptidase NPEPL1
VLAAFEAAVRLGSTTAITAVLCLAENSVGPESTRPDDILTMRSGKTVEVNNTDAEGRLVLADGLAWLCEGDRPDELFDLATLTGAALVATGKVHAALYCSDEALEQRVLAVGRAVGEPCHALPYAPELFRKEFRSPVADMKNSVKDRANAQSSCAGQFIANHLPAGAPPWCHIDLAGPAESADGRGTGFGVGLLLGLLSGSGAIG